MKKESKKSYIDKCAAELCKLAKERIPITCQAVFQDSIMADAMAMAMEGMKRGHKLSSAMHWPVQSAAYVLCSRAYQVYLIEKGYI